MEEISDESRPAGGSDWNLKRAGGWEWPEQNQNQIHTLTSEQLLSSFSAFQTFSPDARWPLAEGTTGADHRPSSER